jgi:hypothetical protein
VTAIRISEFGGLIPMLDAKALPPNCAVDAINTDLRGRGIAPMYSPLHKRDAGSSLIAAAASIVQMPTACLALTGATSSAMAILPPIGGNHLVVANDELVYAVYLPAGTTNAGQGGIDLHFTSGATLGNVVDQNGIGSRDGDITSRAQGVWYVRVISLASVVGLTIDETHFRLWLSGPGTIALTAYFGMAYIRNTGAITKVLFDVDEQTVGTASSLMSASIEAIDEDEAPLVTTIVAAPPWTPALESNRVYTVTPAGFPGFQKNKTVLVQRFPQGVSSQPIRGWSNHDRFAPYTPGTTTGHTFNSRHGWTTTGGQIQAIGWMGVNKPTAAMSLAVLGGAAPTVTRSYVYTRVSEDGLESAPSPPVTVTGNRDGTWQLTNVTSWPGTDAFNTVRSPATKRIYRTPEGSDTYRFVGEVLATVTTVNDTALDDALGEELATAHFDDAPQFSCMAGWKNGIVGGIVSGTQACFSDPYQYHAYPQVNRYTIPYVGVACASFGDRFVILTANKPLWFTGNDPADLLPPEEIERGEACIQAKAVLDCGIGVIYPGRTGWGLVNYSGYENMTREFLSADDYAAIVNANTVALFDDDKLFWITQGATTGYSFEPGGGPRALTKVEVPNPIYAMSYYAPRDTRWIAYTEGGLIKMGKLLGSTTQRMKWTWKSKLITLAKPGRLQVGKIDSEEWDLLGNNMKYREGFYRTIPAWVTATPYAIGDFVTEGGNTYRCDIAHTSGTFAVDLAAVRWILTNTVYSISIAGLEQAESWCYLKVWAEADKASPILVFDDFVVSDRPVRFARVMKSDCWQFELRGNIGVASIGLARSERELATAGG